MSIVNALGLRMYTNEASAMDRKALRPGCSTCRLVRASTVLGLDAMYHCLGRSLQCASLAHSEAAARAQRTGAPASPPQAISTRTSLPRGLCSSAAALPAAASASAWPSDSAPCPRISRLRTVGSFLLAPAVALTPSPSLMSS